MNIKEFFKPTIGKIILFVITFAFFSYFLGNPSLMSLCDPCGCYDTWGYPFHFAEESAVGLNLSAEPFTCGTRITNYSIGFLFIDIIFWYLISCLVVFIYNKSVRKKRKK